MKCKDFAWWWRQELLGMMKDFPNFIKNMGDKDISYYEWISLWMAWNELKSDDDIRNFYAEPPEEI